MEMNEKAILQFIDLDISFRTNAGVVHAIRGVNIELRRGETVAIVGESGSGKSVTVKAAVGLLDGNATVNSGKILYRCKEADGSERVVADECANHQRLWRKEVALVDCVALTLEPLETWGFDSVRLFAFEAE